MDPLNGNASHSSPHIDKEVVFDVIMVTIDMDC